MKHAIKPCDNHAQDQWAELYLQIARTLIETFGIEGKAVVRESIRKFAAHMALDRKNALLDARCKTNLETLFDEGFGFPCGDRTRKEWIRHTEQELFLNVISCPFAEHWGGENHEIGRMFCEEYYPVLVHEGTSEKAQINLGYCMLNGRDDSCRLSLYLRPANVPAGKRAECFPEFDPQQQTKAPVPPYIPDFELQKKYLLHAFLCSAKERLGETGIASVKSGTRIYADRNEDSGILTLLEV